MRATRAAAVCLSLGLLLGSTRAVAAETCPDPGDNAGLRRELAKEWFAKAEEAEAAGDRRTAVKRYSCSLKLIPHPSTAYNLGVAAEKSGDLSLAVDAFKVYLDLAPDAADRTAIETRVAHLESRLAELRTELNLKPAPPAAGAAQAAGPAPDVSPTPRAAPADAAASRPAEDHARRLRVAGWITLGGAAVTGGVATALNVVARSKMHDCFALFPTSPDAALGQCDAAKPLAYTSYGLFALAGGLGVTGLTLLLWHVEDGPTVSLVPSPSGGAALLATGRF
jgi:tetratricopeptide (TPR) repeat protein